MQFKSYKTGFLKIVFITSEVMYYRTILNDAMFKAYDEKKG